MLYMTAPDGKNKSRKNDNGLLITAFVEALHHVLVLIDHYRLPKDQT